MEAYFSFLSAVMRQFVANIGSLFAGTSTINDHFSGYHSLFAIYSGSFGVGGWIFYVLMIVLAIIAVGALGLLLFIGIRKAVLHSKKAKNANEEKMLQEIERLNLELYDVRRENDKLIGLSREYGGDLSRPDNIQDARKQVQGQQDREGGGDDAVDPAHKGIVIILQRQDGLDLAAADDRDKAGIDFMSFSLAVGPVCADEADVGFVRRRV